MERFQRMFSMDTLCINNMRPTLYDRVGRLLESFECSDCSFRVGTELIRAHKLILGISSPVFKVMLYGSLVETREISVPDIDPDIFQLMIDFIYRDKVKIESLDVGCGLLYAAKKYMLIHLSDICIEHIEKLLSISNVLSIYPYAEWLQEERLVKSCLTIISKHANYIFTKEIDHLTGSTFRRILEQNSINIGEKELIEFADKWAHNECVQQELEVTGENKREMLVKNNSFTLLRFFTLGPKDVEWITKLDILTKSEKDVLKDVLTEKAEYSSETNSLESSHITLCLPRGEPDVLNPTTAKRMRLKMDWTFCCRTTIRTACPLVIERNNQNVKVKIKCNKTIFITSIAIPTRQTLDVSFQASDTYQENILLEIYRHSDKKDEIKSKCCGTTAYNSSHYLDLPQPFVFEENEWYTVMFTWPEVSPPYKYPLCYRPVMSSDSIFTFDDNSENLMPCGSLVHDLKFCI